MEKLLFDQLNKKYFQISHKKNGWTVKSSTDKKNWKIEKLDLTLSDVMKLKHDIILNNHKHLLSIIKN